ncbi:ATP-binding protein [Acaryochloris marina NIES-2412]|uniref:ATP-binding protein n=1 Tax=Acaryochloris marina TaxID=155978 RepID=UPI004059715A
MEFEEAKRIISELSIAKRGKRLNLTGEIAIKAAWEDITIANAMKDHPSSSSTTQGYIASRVGPALWKFLSKEFGIEIKKKNLRLIFEQLEAEGLFTNKKASFEKTNNRKISTQVDDLRSKRSIQGSHLPDVPHFYGREDDLLNLTTAIFKNRCVALVGAAGIGKSALASIYVQRAASKGFQNIIWMSLHPSQTIDELLAYYLDDGQLDTLLQESRCLLVIDCGSAELKEDSKFKSIVQKFCEDRHQSSLLILSRNIVTTVKQLTRTQRPATTIKLKGLADQDALKILNNQGIHEESDCYKLIESYRGNPQLLLLAAERINRFCGGRLEPFLLHKTSFASDYVRQVIREYKMNELTLTEQKILTILIQSGQETPKWTAFSDLMTHLSSGKESASMSELIEVLEKWEGMSLIESVKDPSTGEATFMLPPATRKVLMRSTLTTLSSLSQPA